MQVFENLKYIISNKNKNFWYFFITSIIPINNVIAFWQ